MNIRCISLSLRVSEDDPRLIMKDVKIPSDDEDINAYYARPKKNEKFPGVVVIAEIWGLVPHIEDIARRVAIEGFIAVAPDPLSPLGGTPEDAREAVQMMRQLDSEETVKNLVAAVEYLKTHPQSTGKVGVTGFCWGGGMTGAVAVNTEDVQAAVPFYGRVPAIEDVPKIKAAVLGHYAASDERINAGLPAFKEAMKEAGIEHSIHIYEGTRHGFLNDTRDVYDEEASELAWKRTIDFFKEKLGT